MIQAGSFGTITFSTGLRAKSGYVSRTTTRILTFVTAFIAALGAVGFGCALGGVLNPGYLAWIGLAVFVVFTYVSYRIKNNMPPPAPIADVEAAIAMVDTYVSRWSDSTMPDDCTLVMPGLYYSQPRGQDGTTRRQFTDRSGFDTLFLNESFTERSAGSDVNNDKGDNWHVDDIHFHKCRGRDYIIRQLHHKIQSGKRVLVESGKLIHLYLTSLTRVDFQAALYLGDAGISTGCRADGLADPEYMGQLYTDLPNLIGKR